MHRSLALVFFFLVVPSSVLGQCDIVNWEHVEPVIQFVADLSKRWIKFKTGSSPDVLLAKDIERLGMHPVEMTDFILFKTMGYSVRSVQAKDLVNLQMDPPEALDEQVLYTLAVADQVKATIVLGHPLFPYRGVAVSMKITDIRMQGQLNVLMYQCNSGSWFDPFSYFCSLKTVYDLMTKNLLDVLKSRTGHVRIEKVQTDISKVEDIQVEFVRLNDHGQIVSRSNSTFATVPLRVLNGINNRLPQIIQEKRRELMDAIAKTMMNRLLFNQRHHLNQECPTSSNYQVDVHH